MDRPHDTRKVGTIKGRTAKWVQIDERFYPITNYFDEDGEECDPEDAVAAVAGDEGYWIVLELGGPPDTIH